jgi:molybdopterin molybdotransferase
MISVDDAKNIILKSTNKLKSENVDLIDSLNRISYEDISTSINLPRWDNSSMDGYALIISDDSNKNSSQKLQVIGEVYPGDDLIPKIKENTAIKIMTGAPIPRGANCVIPKEDINLIKSNNKSPNYILFDKKLNIGDNIRIKGSDFNIGEEIILKGNKIRSFDVAKLAANGINKIKVYKKPVVSIISTGNELIAPGDKLKPFNIYDSNALSIASLVKSVGGIPKIIGIAKDEIRSIEATLRDSIDSDVIICTAGVSVGDKDYIKEVIKEHGKINFWSVNIQPGKPFLYGDIQGRGEIIPFFGLPGNPVSTIVLMIKFILPSLLNMQGWINYKPNVTSATLNDQIENYSRRNMFARVKVERIEGELIATPYQNNSSHVLSSFDNSNGLANVPENCKILKKGAQVEVEIFDSTNLI